MVKRKWLDDWKYSWSIKDWLQGDWMRFEGLYWSALKTCFLVPEYVGISIAASILFFAIPILTFIYIPTLGAFLAFYVAAPLFFGFLGAIGLTIFVAQSENEPISWRVLLEGGVSRVRSEWLKLVGVVCLWNLAIGVVYIAVFAFLGALIDIFDLDPTGAGTSVLILLLISVFIWSLSVLFFISAIAVQMMYVMIVCGGFSLKTAIPDSTRLFLDNFRIVLPYSLITIPSLCFFTTIPISILISYVWIGIEPASGLSSGVSIVVFAIAMGIFALSHISLYRDISEIDDAIREELLAVVRE